MILITSAAYVSPGLVAEFGKLPPCMLPVQNKRLYVHQIKLLQLLNENIILSLPKGFELTSYDSKLLAELHVHTVFVPTELSLGASVVYVLNVMGRFNESLRILHGDTLLDDIPNDLDVCSVSKAEDDYSWETAANQNDNLVYAGYFSFSSQATFIRAIIEQGYSFTKGLTQYQKELSMKNVPANVWYDFGIVNSYYRSKSKMTTQRVFNDLKINKYSVTKRSKDVNKMLAEANWFKSIPVELKRFTPALWRYGAEGEYGYYEIEYFYLSSLAELFVFGNNPFFVWKNIIDSCVDFINQIGAVAPDNKKEIAQQSISLYGEKTRLRLAEYTKAASLDLDEEWQINGIKVPSLNAIVEDISRDLDVSQEKFMSILHGDFCFSNTLYDFKSQSIKVLDPRGRDLDGKLSIYGDIRYDVGKIAHSVIGLYDFIIGGFYKCGFNGKYSMNLTFPVASVVKELQAYFMKLYFAGYSTEELSVYPILIHLFLSMLPLHSDHPSRQQAMLANALRIYADYKLLK